MKSIFQRFMALALSMVIFLGTFMTVYAADVEPEEMPEAEKVNEKEEVVQVVLPTSAVGIFDFILDPQELIRETDAAAYGGKKFEDGATLFFERSDGRTEEDYASDSDAITITNRGNGPLEVSVNASISVTNAEGLAMTDDREFTDDIGASLYLALTDGETTVPITLDEGADIHVVLPADSEEMGENDQYLFWLTGEANRNGDWSDLKDMEIEVTVTWDVTPIEGELLPVDEVENLLDEEKRATPSTVAKPPTATASDVDKK